MSQRSWFVLMAVLLIVLLGAAIGAPLHQGKEKAPETAVEEDQTGEDAIPVQGLWTLVRNSDEVRLLGRLVAAEAMGEPYEGQVAVAAVLLNRVKHPSFPNTIQGVIYQPLAFESVLNGHIWRVTNLSQANRAAQAALNGWDPTYGALYFWNPSKPVSPWIWTRRIVRQIGSHVFGI
ncbi:MAG: spore cortex-lytic protein [Clostridia bacterium]|jgi:N-acetylmuramoyl-L-alanine amidase|nr:spore cortex-lytic protein [Clostridia bacterium]